MLSQAILFLWGSVILYMFCNNMSHDVFLTKSDNTEEMVDEARRTAAEGD
jgi:hypothetical protein